MVSVLAKSHLQKVPLSYNLTVVNSSRAMKLVSIS